MLVTKTIELTGGRKGKTVVLRGHQFTKGRLTITGPDRDVAKMMKFMHRNFQTQEVSDGQTPPTDGDDPVSSDGQPGVEGASEDPAVDGPIDADSEDGASGSVPEGDGQEDPGADEMSLEQTRLLEAVHALDPENDDHWTAEDKPAMVAVESFYGSADVTRRDVEEVAPGYGREEARARQ